mmetsp:Transcript_17740/g.32282  ORF Transcript_17740/g.32282 Transcript_17740/m.32282 type:complete len:100 (-) Transcript_17740:470-769(-)
MKLRGRGPMRSNINCRPYRTVKSHIGKLSKKTLRTIYRMSMIERLTSNVSLRPKKGIAEMAKQAPGTAMKEYNKTWKTESLIDVWEAPALISAENSASP